jgi:hypothetical protein
MLCFIFFHISCLSPYKRCSNSLLNLICRITSEFHRFNGRFAKKKKLKKKVQKNDTKHISLKKKHVTSTYFLKYIYISHMLKDILLLNTDLYKIFYKLILKKFRKIKNVWLLYSCVYASRKKLTYLIIDLGSV